MSKKEQEIRQKREEYVKKNLWKKFFKYKIMELGIIPLAIIALIYIPYGVGWLHIYAFHTDPSTSTFFCSKEEGWFSSSTYTSVECVGGYSKYMIWWAGAFWIVALTIFILINWSIAESRTEDEAAEKFPWK